MINIGKPYLKEEEGLVKLCADIDVNGSVKTLWFGVSHENRDMIAADRADSFVIVLLFLAERLGQNIVSEAPVSRKLLYELRHYVVPVVFGKKFDIIADPSDLTYAGSEIATGFSGGVDSMYTVMMHGSDSEYPLTTLCVFNTGVYEGERYRDTYREALKNAGAFADLYGYKLVGIDSNIREVLPERYLDVYSFRLAAFALLLQKSVRVYLFSSGHRAVEFEMDRHNTATYDLFSIYHLSSESFSFFLSGCEITRVGKIQALCDYAPSKKWLAPCVFSQRVGTKNCGHCKKCIRDMSVLYSMGRLDEYSAVFDIDDYLRNISLRMGFVFANEEPLCHEAAEFIKKSGIAIPEKSYIFEKQFRTAMQNLKQKKQDTNEDQ